MGRCDMFLKVVGSDGPVRGESRDAKFTDQIELESWGWGMTVPTAVGSGAATGRRLLRALTVHKRADASSAPLMSILKGNGLVTATLTVRKAGKEALPYFVVTLKKARLVEYAVDSAVSAEGAPVLNERISFSFQSINIQYTEQDASGIEKGSMEFEDTWDLMS